MNIDAMMRLAKHKIISITSEWGLSYKIDEAYRILKAKSE